MSKIQIKLPGGDGEKTINVEVGSLAQEETLRDLVKIMGGKSKDTALTTRTSQRAVDDLGDAAEAATDALEDTAVSFEEISDEVDASAARMAAATKEFKKNLSSDMFANTKSLFSGMSSPMDFLKDSAKDLGGGFKGLIESAAAGSGATASLARGMLMLGGPITLLVAAVGAALAFFVGRAKKNIEMYDNALKSGAQFAGGLEQFRDTVSNSSLNLDDFNSVMSKNSSSFAYFGGTVAKGAAKFAGVSKEVGKFSIKMANLGISQEEMGNLQATYMETLAATGEMTKDRSRSDSVVAKGAMDYAMNLKTMSTLTGQTVEDLKAERLEKSKDFRTIIAARKFAQEQGISEAAAKEMIINQMQQFPQAQEAVLSQYMNNGQIVGKEAAAQAALLGGSTKAIHAGYTAATNAIAAGGKDLGTITAAQGKEQARFAGEVRNDMAVGSAAYNNAMNAAIGVTNSQTEAAKNMIINGERSAKMTENAGEAQQAVSDAANDTESAMAKQNALNAAMYDVQRKLLNATDKLAIDGMAKLNDAMINLAFSLYSNFSSIMGEMPESLKEMKKQMDANAQSERQAALDKKTAAMKPEEQAALASAASSAVSKDSISAAQKESETFEDTSALAGAAEGALYGAAVGSFIPVIGTAAGAVIGAGLGAWAAWGTDELDEITRQREEIRRSEAGKKLSEEEINTLIRSNYLKQGKILDESMTRITDAPAPPTASGTEVPKAAGGGILSGASSGFAAILHGTEAVVPLPDNKSIPVTMNAPDTSEVTNTMKQVRDLLMSQNALLTELLDHTKTGIKVQKDIRNLNY